MRTVIGATSACAATSRTAFRMTGARAARGAGNAAASSADICGSPRCIHAVSQPVRKIVYIRLLHEGEVRPGYSKHLQACRHQALPTKLAPLRARRRDDVLG